MSNKIGFIGGGNMAYAIGGGFVMKGLRQPSSIWVSGPHVENLERWIKLGINITTDNAELFSECDVIFLAVKPHVLDEALSQVKSSYKKTSAPASKLVISVLAGVTTDTLNEKLNYFDAPRIIRTMPNTPLLVGDGVVLFCAGKGASDEDVRWLHSNLGQLGLCESVTEDMFDAFSSLSGCGPAFMFLVHEALVSGAVGCGVRHDMARRVAARVIRGAGTMLSDPVYGKQHPAELRDNVTSPGGSTAAGLAQLEKNGVRSAFIQAIIASTEKNSLLGKQH